MKKLALSSLIAVFAVSGAHAANVIDGNPLYMPKANHFYSVTDLNSHTEGTPWAIDEEFGYGITDKLAVAIKTSVSENDAFDKYAWDDVAFNAAFRVFDANGWKLDALAEYGFTDLYNHPKVAGGDAWFDKDNTNYMWTAGVRGGYVASNWTVAAKALFSYLNTESFNWGDEGVHAWTLGLDGQYLLCDKLNLVAGVEYTGFTDDGFKNAGMWEGMFGVNYNIDSTKYVGVYVNGSLNHQEGSKADEWGWDDGFGFGAKFGIDF